MPNWMRSKQRLIVFLFSLVSLRFNFNFFMADNRWEPLPKFKFSVANKSSNLNSVLNNHNSDLVYNTILWLLEALILRVRNIVTHDNLSDAIIKWFMIDKSNYLFGNSSYLIILFDVFDAKRIFDISVFWGVTTKSIYDSVAIGHS